MKMRPIEMYRIMEDGTWDTVMVEIPANTDPNRIEEVARIQAVKKWGLAAYTLYNSMDDECPDGVPPRSQVEVMLSFDMDQQTVGSEIEQQRAAIDQINLTLQRDPYGLGARIYRKTS